MKLKEKLSKEFYKDKVETPLNGLSWEQASDIIFIAGFNKARELAAELIHYREDIRLKEKMANLGEEEVVE